MQFAKIYILIALAAILVALSIFVYAFRQSISGDNIPNLAAPPLLEKLVLTSEQKNSLPAEAKFSFYIESGKKLKVIWTNIPADTSKIMIFRRLISGGEWEEWVSVDIPLLMINGAVELVLLPEDSPGSYEYSAQTLADSGVVGWIVSNLTPTYEPPPYETEPLEPQPEGTPPTDGDGGPSGDTPPPPGGDPGGEEGNTPNPTSSTPAPTSTGNPGAQTYNWIYYYLPNGQLSGTTTLSNQNFWIARVNNAIQINWQNLPTGTNGLTVYRSDAESGPWTQLFAQNNITSAPGSLQITDYSYGETQYYKMEARSGMQILGSYGPILLPGL